MRRGEVYAAIEPPAWQTLELEKMLDGLSKKLGAIIGSDASLLKMLNKAKESGGAEGSTRTKKKKPVEAMPDLDGELSFDDAFDEGGFSDFDDEEGLGDLDIAELDMDALDEFDLLSEDDEGQATGAVPRQAVAQIVEDILEAKLEQMEENTQAIKTLQSTMSKMDVTFSTVKRDSDEVKERINAIDENILELLSLYEIVSNQVNPFVGEEKSSATIKKIDELEDKIKAIVDSTERMQRKFEEPPELPIPPDFQESIDHRFEVFEGSIQAMTQAFDELSSHVTNIDDGAIQMLKESIVEEIRTKPLTDEAILMVKEAVMGDLQKTLSTETPADGGLQTITLHKGELKVQDTQVDDVGPARLNRLNNKPESVITLIHWIEFLMERVGRNNLLDVLEYYVEIRWISDEIRDTMLSYASGIDYYVEKPTWRLLPEDHTKSLLFIERLKGNKISRTTMNMVERELSKVKHLEEMYGV